MSAPYSCVYVSLTDSLSAAIDDDLARMNTHQAQAEQLSRSARQHTEHGVVTAWASAGDLRTWSQAEQTAQLFLDRALRRGALRSRVMFRAYQHHAWCAVRSVAHVVRDIVRLTLAQVAQRFTAVNPAHDHDPPGLLGSRSVLSLCHASNAPGVSRVATHRQVCRNA